MRRRVRDMTEATTLETIRAVLETCPSLAEVIATWVANQPAIKSLSADDRAALVKHKDNLKKHWDAMPPEAEDTWVADFMEGRI